MKDNVERKKTLLLCRAFSGIASRGLYVERETAPGWSTLTQGQWQIAWPAGQGPERKETRQGGTRRSGGRRVWMDRED